MPNHIHLYRADIMAYKADTVSIFGNMDNRGRFGSAVGSGGTLLRAAVEQYRRASLPDERFYHPSAPTAAFSGSCSRRIPARWPYHVFGGYSASGNAGASFPNPQHQQYHERAGRPERYQHPPQPSFRKRPYYPQWLEYFCRRRFPGITGYSHQRFIVTGSTPYGGYLYRKQASAANGQLVFSCSGAGSYTPLALRYSGTTADNFAARVFDNVLSYAQTGSILQSNRRNPAWQARPQSGAETIVWLQHNPPEQDAGFAQNTDSSFITRFIVPTGWDTVSPAGFTRLGNFTTGMPLTEALVHTRSFIGRAIFSFPAHLQQTTGIKVSRYPYLRCFPERHPLK